MISSPVVKLLPLLDRRTLPTAKSCLTPSLAFRDVSLAWDTHAPIRPKNEEGSFATCAPHLRCLPFCSPTSLTRAFKTKSFQMLHHTVFHPCPHVVEDSRDLLNLSNRHAQCRIPVQFQPISSIARRDNAGENLKGVSQRSGSASLSRYRPASPFSFVASSTTTIAWSTDVAQDHVCDRSRQQSKSCEWIYRKMELA